MTIVNIHEAKTHLSRLLEAVAKGETVTIAKAGKPIADLVPHQRMDLVFGGMAGELTWTEDAFSEETDREIWANSEYAW